MKAIEPAQHVPANRNLDSCFAAAANLVAALAATVRIAKSPLNRTEFERAERVLAALPLGLDHYQVLKQRLQNGWRYVQAGESGAAVFELRQISNGLAHWPKGQRILYVQTEPGSTDSNNDEGGHDAAA